MKKYIWMMLLCTMFCACGKNDVESESVGDRPCGTNASGQKLYTGPKGGCFYFSSNGNKTYVDRSECKCG